MTTEADLQLYRDTTICRIAGQVKVITDLNKKVEKYIDKGALKSARNLAPSVTKAAEKLNRMLDEFEKEVERLECELLDAD